MQIRVLFFGMLKDITGTAGEPMNLPDGATLGDVVRHYQELRPRFRELADCCAISVNQEYAGPQAKLKAGDEVAFLPPVSGGAADPPRRAEIVREKIEPQLVLDQIKQPSDGATVIFEGVVRDNTRGRHTLYLDYEAYEDMALKQMEGLIEAALKQFPVRDATIVHRLGRLQIGETSVLIVVAAAHRAAAFDACRWLIDTLKRTVPIWKKEYFQDGAVWADGEPFPTGVPTASGSHPEEAASK
jgi:molybdopterin converting factor subunit 1